MRQTIIVDPTLDNLRLDCALREKIPSYSRSEIQKWIKKGQVFVDAKLVTETKVIVHEGQVIDCEVTEREALHDQPQDIPFSIVAETETFLVINKPANLVVHPGNGQPDGTLLNGLLHYCPSLSELPRAGIVHRLDKDTTGLMVVCKTDSACKKMVLALKSHEVTRKYTALVSGVILLDGKVDAPIGRHRSRRTRMAVVESGKPSTTRYHVCKRFVNSSLIECALETGRTHQIRVHMASINHPLIGDRTYGKTHTFSLYPHQALHAHHLSFADPQSGEPVSFDAPLPQDFQKLLARIDTDTTS